MHDSFLNLRRNIVSYRQRLLNSSINPLFVVPFERFFLSIDPYGRHLFDLLRYFLRAMQQERSSSKGTGCKQTTL